MSLGVNAMKLRLVICLSLILAGCRKPDTKNTQQATPAPTPTQTVEKTVENLPPPAANTPSSIVKELFPNATKTVRHIGCFRSFARGISMYAVVDKCGRPDQEMGSGIGIFIYHLEDKSTVTIRYTDINHIQDIEHVDKSGKTTSLLVKP
jgi:PBP1b-binding outer membrane lipoprotein LpoB